MRRLSIIVLTLIVACSDVPAPPLVASDVVVTRPMPGMKMSAAYMSLTNNSNEVVRITRAASSHYESVQFHETTIKDGVARMRAMPALEIPAGATVTLQRGGKHLMLMRPTGPTDTVTLEFLDGDDLLLAIDATVEPPAP
ncbi:MAG: copper chaperone PCu(A)C [Woeseiaceae bacterium]